MNKKAYKLYKQCKIARGQAQYIAWIPVNLAYVGKTVVPKNADPATIQEVYGGVILTHQQLVEYYNVKEYGEVII